MAYRFCTCAASTESPTNEYKKILFYSYVVLAHKNHLKQDIKIAKTPERKSTVSNVQTPKKVDVHFSARNLSIVCAGHTQALTEWAGHWFWREPNQATARTAAIATAKEHEAFDVKIHSNIDG
ncbi:unnamed protein product [Ceratitis capitata]|uniref:(Mediterranean fruit fly) hypothetical protein n=1 Tax=Ceratitis capitata TaxID=7213 RepID=A0A811UA88_CERCA|nr:unnamed protein product [Ceratitis capitata]